ncbi:MAG: hypothetical protein WCX82_00350 [archaeon]|jgi:hypothetical protein
MGSFLNSWFNKPKSNKYNEIYLLVHPLFHYTHGGYSYCDLTRISTQLSIKRILNQYGQILQKMKNNPKAIYVVVTPGFDINGVKNEQKIPVYTLKEKNNNLQLLRRFFNFGETELGDRFIVTNFDSTTEGMKKLFERKMYAKFDKQVKLKYFGEYQDACVESWSSYVSRELNERKIKTTKDLLVDSTLALEFRNSESKWRNIPLTKLEKGILKKQKAQFQKIDKQRKSLIKKTVNIINQHARSKAK